MNGSKIAVMQETAQALFTPGPVYSVFSDESQMDSRGHSGQRGCRAVQMFRPNRVN